jgi:hypothetical protein
MVNMIRLSFFLIFIVFASLFTGVAGAEAPGAGTSQAVSPNGTDQVIRTEAGEAAVPGAVDFIPILSLYRTVLAGEVPWRPDWPLSVPPDAFVFPADDVSALTLVGGVGDTAEELTVRRNNDGLLSEFPLFRGGGVFQVQTRFGSTALIRGFTIASETPWDILIVEYEEAFPSLIRVTHGKTMYIVMIEYAAVRAEEIWYAQDGNALAVFSFQYETPGGRMRRLMITDLVSGEKITEVYHYDSMGNISGIISAAGEYSALYVGEGKPRYWERVIPAIPDTDRPVQSAVVQRDSLLREAAVLSTVSEFDHFSLQWDEESLLTRLTGIYRRDTSPENPDDQGSVAGRLSIDASGYSDVEETDVRYKYIRDEQGNWIERQDTPMIRRFGFLVPDPAEWIIRRIEYSAP